MGTLAWISFIVWSLGCMTNKKLNGGIHVFLVIAIVLWFIK